MTVNLSMFAGVGWQLFDNSGNVLSGGKLFTYAAGTTTPATAYTTSAGTVAHTNPIILDAAGRVPGGEIWLTENTLYKFVVKTSTDVLIATYDNVSGGSDGISTFQTSLANTSDAAKGDALVGFRQSNSTGLLANSIGRTVHQKLQETVSVLDFGADPTGVQDATAAINNALSSGAKRVYAPAGTYQILGSLILPQNVSLYGDGSGATLFDGSGAPFASLTNASHITTTGSSYTALPALSVAVAKGDQTLSLLSSPSLEPNDVILIYNPTDFSYSNWRSYYYAGEFLRVASVSGATVRLQGTTCAAYATSAVNLYKMTNPTTAKLTGFSLKGSATTANAVFGINLYNGLDCVLDDVRVYNCSYAGIHINQCFNTTVTACFAGDDQIETFGGDYGLIISNSHIVHVLSGYYSAGRHGFTTGGAGGIGAVPCRYVTVTGSHITTSSAGGVQAADFHGNTEYSGFYGCTIDGGMSVGGNIIEICNNVIRGTDLNGRVAIYCSEVTGLDWLISGNAIETKYYSTGNSRGSFIDFGGNNDSIGSGTSSGGTLTISGNNMLWNVSTSDSIGMAIRIANRGYVGTQAINVRISENTIRTLSSAIFAGVNPIEVYSGNPFESVTISGNNFGPTGVSISSVVSGGTVARYVYVHNNIINNGGGAGISVNGASITASVKGNTITSTALLPIFVAGPSNASRCQNAHIMNNTTLYNGTSVTSSTSTNTNIAIFNVRYAICQSNATGSFNRMLYVSSIAGFVAGETITGSSSGATGVIASTAVIGGSSVINLLTSAVGSFTSSDTITGSTSGATATVSSFAYNMLYRCSYVNINQVWQGQNVSINGASDFSSNVTINTPI